MKPRLEKQIVISGAGPVGLAFALGLRNSPLKITLVDAKPRPSTAILEQDTRMIAVSKGSAEFLESIGVWGALKPFATPIEHVKISERGYATEVLMSVSEHQLEDFGALIPLGRLILVMLELVEKEPSIDYRPATRLAHYRTNGMPGIAATEAICTLESMEKTAKSAEAEEIVAEWVISAEGMNSHLRMLSGIETYQTDYSQVAVIAKAEFEKPHHNVAYERFTSEGPLALLPVGSHEMAVVLIADKDEKQKWLAASDERYSDEIIYRIGYELGEVKQLSPRHVWDLTLMLPKNVVKERLILIGNSAHSLHPIAGQGLNLGFRDAAELLPYFQYAGGLPTAHDLKRYERARRKDALKVAGATDFLVRGFGIEWPGVPTLRNFALKGVQWLTPLKKRIARFGMGVKH